MGKMSRDKGKRFERQVATWLQANGLPDARRTAQNCGKSGDAADVVGLPGIHIECKAVEKPRVWEFLKQAHEDSFRTKNIPVVIWKKNTCRWIAFMEWDAWLKYQKKTGKNKFYTEMRKGSYLKPHQWLEDEELLQHAEEFGKRPAVIFRERDTDAQLVMMYAIDFLMVWKKAVIDRGNV